MLLRPSFHRKKFVTFCDITCEIIGEFIGEIIGKIIGEIIFDIHVAFPNSLYTQMKP